MLSVGVVAGLGAAGYIRDYVPVGLALTTTALGTLLPILRDNRMLGGPFGRYVLAAGAVGELFPILISPCSLPSGDTSPPWPRWRGRALALVLSQVPGLTRCSTVARVIAEGQDATAQITLRWATVLLFALLAFASRFGLDVVLGAMLAGIVLRGWTRQGPPGHQQPRAQVRYGGLRDLHPDLFRRLRDDPRPEGDQPDPLRLFSLFLLLVSCGACRRCWSTAATCERERVEMTFITATTMPLLIALAEIGEQDGVMLPATSAALVGAGVLSVLI